MAYDQIAGIAVTGHEGGLLLGSKKDLTIQGAVLQNLGTNGSTGNHAEYTLSLSTNLENFWDNYSESIGVSSSSYSLSTGVAYTYYVGNIRDKHIWNPGENIRENFNVEVMDYYKSHKEENLSLYVNRYNTFVLLKSIDGKIYQYTGYGKNPFIYVPHFNSEKKIYCYIKRGINEYKWYKKN